MKMIPVIFSLWHLSLKFVCRGYQRHCRGKYLPPGSGLLAQEALAGQEAALAGGCAPPTASSVPGCCRAVCPEALFGQQLPSNPSQAVVHQLASGKTLSPVGGPQTS